MCSYGLIWNGVIAIGRNPRVQYAEACYHIIQRGNNKEAIFKQDKEKLFFLELLRIVAVKYNCLIFAYAVMDNHYHLLIQIQNETLSQVMHMLNGRYAQFYNWRHNRKGHVFQDRFKAYLIKDDLHLLTVLRYIHQNGVRAKVVGHMSAHRWCSDQDYRNQPEGLIEANYILNILSENPQEALFKYRELMREPVTDMEKEAIYSATKLDQTEVEARSQSAEESAASLSSMLKPRPPNHLDDILQHCCVDVIEFDLIKNGSRSRALKEKKSAYIKQARQAGYTLEEIGANISMTNVGISKVIQKKS